MEPMLIPWMMARKRKNPSEVSEEIPLTKLPKRIIQKPQFRLVSFCTRDMAETSRMILAYAGVPFDNFTMFDLKNQLQDEFGKF